VFGHFRSPWVIGSSLSRSALETPRTSGV
jgi:hypothetical protein